MFEIGDKVVYIQDVIDSELSGHYVERYKTYTITNVGKKFVKLEGVIYVSIHKKNIIHLNEFRKQKINKICLE